MTDAGNFDYFQFELQFRGSPAEIKDRLRVHVDRFTGRHDVLDLGCGRGEFLELMAEADIPARGVDADDQMVEACVGRGLNVVKADVIAYLADLKDESLGGAFSAHLIEHLSAARQRRLIELCSRKLKAGAPLVLETPNPLSLAALPNQLTLDPTHEKLVHPQLLRFMLTSSGFKPVELVPLHGWAPGVLLEPIQPGPGSDAVKQWIEALNRNFARLNQLLFSAQDYAAVAWKDAGKSPVRRARGGVQRGGPSRTRSRA